MPDPTPQPDAAPQLEGGTYEIIRNRLRGYGEELRARLSRLNAARKDVFGSIDVKLLATERITTEHNCVPRDMAAVGDRFLFGYNVHFGLKTERHIADVFAAYEFRRPGGESGEASAEAHGLQPVGFDVLGLNDPRFEKDLQDVYRYYKNATFAQFVHRGPHLFMVFQVGRSPLDVKTFKWLLRPEGLQYLDNRSDHEVRPPPQHEFEWIRCTRDMHRQGVHPHISIEDRLFVETVGGDLTIKIENNTDSGQGIYSEPVDNADQTLDDAETYYAIVGNLILLKIKPYQEARFRYIVYSEKIEQARRLDAIEQACVLLPDDHGLIFSSGYFLQSGEYKTFDSAHTGLLFERRIASPNGEDTLFVFHQPQSGDYVLLGYNMIEQKVETPVVCNGFTLFHAGEMLQFKVQPEPQKHHAVQVWQTPYVGENYVPPTNSDSYLYKIGNRDIVRGMAECQAILKLIDKEDSYSGLYVDLVKLTTDVLDSYFWIGHAGAENLAEPLAQIRDAARSAVDEFEKVVRVRKNTAEQTQQVQQKTRALLSEVHRARFDAIDGFVRSLAGLRGIRGEIIGLKELRYVDLPTVEGLEQEVTQETERLSHRCVEFLLRPDALQPYADKVADEQAAIEGLQKVSEAKKQAERIGASATELEMLIEIVSNLKIDDATQRTAIIDGISAVFTKVNTARAALKRKMQELASVEGAAEFGSQLKLLNQSVVNFLDVCDAPQKCEEYLTKLMVQVEELEGKFAEFDEFVVQLAEKRDEIYNAFETRRLQLVEARNKRAGALASAADRILKGIKSRVDGLESVNDIHGYFAGDLMIEKVRDIVRQLDGLGDSVKVDDIQSRLKTIREDAVRQLKDKQELYEDGENVIKFGKHRFSVNTQVLDLTTVQRDGDLCLHLTGTDFYEPLNNPEIDALDDVRDMEVVSENRDVYRAEYLAYQILSTARTNDESPFIRDPKGSAAPRDLDSLTAEVQRFMAPRYSEGYTKGVHDHDAALLLQALLEIDATCGLLRYSSLARAVARLFWEYFADKRVKTLMGARLAGFGAVAQAFPGTTQQAEYIEELQEMLAAFLAEVDLFGSPSRQQGPSTPPDADSKSPSLARRASVDDALAGEAAEYLFYELTTGDTFAVSQAAADLVREFKEHLHVHGRSERFTESLHSLQKATAPAFELIRDWVRAYVDSRSATHDYVDEASVCLLAGSIDERRIVAAETDREINGLAGTHPAIAGGRYSLNFNRFLHKLAAFERDVVPRFQRYHHLKTEIVDDARSEMKLNEFKPRVLTSFVRNRLIDTTYLPLIGDNLAKQVGTAGEQKRTDRQGLLLLISPPGYGKTTLMEYVANRLGIIFMKINGPALGHEVKSLDPQAAPNAGAREEVEKLSLAFEMGDNVMIYLDDIQHCHPEFLQKFISLCDAQRKVEGVYKGHTRTYDFRGKKVCVVMAGNPYTESGEKFKIPDMLANRADIYNLGEIIGDSGAAFEMSYLENALTSNPVLARLASRSRGDVQAVIQMAERARTRADGSAVSAPENLAALTEGIDLEGTYPLDELGEYVNTMIKLLRVRDVVLTMNKEYIKSAATHDDYRTEPPFLLQGSYRNMNRIAEKVLPVMNVQELETLIVSSYQNDAQTLTSGTEWNLLKFKELLGKLTPQEQERCEDIRRTFRQNVKLRGVGADDKVGLVIAQLSTFADGLDSIRKAVTTGVGQLTDRNGHDDHIAAAVNKIEALNTGLTSLSERINDGLAQIARLADRPIEIDVPPIDVKWPETLPAALSDRSAGGQSAPAVTQAAPAENRPIVRDATDADDDQGDDSSRPDRITVVNRLPRSVLNVMEQQFQLMNGWMKPVLELTAQQRTEMAELRPMIEECLRHYRSLLRKLEEAHDRDAPSQA